MSHYPVVIVGAGPTGLTLANLLARYGVDFLLVERNAGTVEDPRAVSIDDESLRTLQAAGVIDTVMPDIVPGYGSIYYTPDRKPFAKVEPTGAPYGYPRRNAFRQPRLEAQLRDALRARDAEMLFGWRLESFVQSADGVALRLGGDGRTRRITCDYLVGCDGAASTVRDTLGIVLEGATYAKRWLIVDLENNANSTKHTEVFCDIRQPCITLPGPDRTRRFEFELLADAKDEDALAPDHVAALLSGHGADPEATIRRKAIYRFHARLAPRWSEGRVFLAGDAAHLTPPFAGQGMNSGLRDAHNLAWKLAAVVSGRVGSDLLRSYEQERRDHVQAMINLALHMGRVMSPPSRWAALTTQLAFRLLNLWLPARDYVTQMKYKPKPRFERGFMLSDGRSARRTLVGRLIPQPRVLTTDGRSVLLDDVIGPRAALLIRTATPREAFAALAHPAWSRLDTLPVAVLPFGGRPMKISGGATVVEQSNAFADALGADRDHVILLRPDRYVAACFPLDRADAAAAAWEALLAGTWTEAAGPDRGLRAPVADFVSNGW